MSEDTEKRRKPLPNNAAIAIMRCKLGMQAVTNGWYGMLYAFVVREHRLPDAFEEAHLRNMADKASNFIAENGEGPTFLKAASRVLMAKRQQIVDDLGDLTRYA